MNLYFQTYKLIDRPELFFAVEGYRPKYEFRECVLKKPIDELFENLLKPTPRSFRRFFDKIRRESFDRALSLSQARVESELEDDDEMDQDMNVDIPRHFLHVSPRGDQLSEAEMITRICDWFPLWLVGGGM